MKEHKKKSIKKAVYKADIDKLIKYCKKNTNDCDYIITEYFDVITLEQKLKLYKFASIEVRSFILDEVNKVAYGMEESYIEILYDWLCFEKEQGFNINTSNINKIYNIIFESKKFNKILYLIESDKKANKLFKERLNKDIPYVVSLIDYLISKKMDNATYGITTESLETKVLESRDDKLISTYAQYHEVYNRNRVETKLIEIGDPKTLYQYMGSKVCTENFDRKKAINKIIEKDNLEYILKTYVYLEHNMFDNMDIETFFQGVMSLDMQNSEKEFLIKSAFYEFANKEKAKYEDDKKAQIKSNVYKSLSKQNTCNN